MVERPVRVSMNEVTGRLGNLGTSYQVQCMSTAASWMDRLYPCAHMDACKGNLSISNRSRVAGLRKQHAQVPKTWETGRSKGQLSEQTA